MLDWSREVVGEGRGRGAGGNITDDQKFVISVGREESSETAVDSGTAAAAAWGIVDTQVLGMKREDSRTLQCSANLDISGGIS